MSKSATCSLGPNGRPWHEDCFPNQEAHAPRYQHHNHHDYRPRQQSPQPQEAESKTNQYVPIPPGGALLTPGAHDLIGFAASLSRALQDGSAETTRARAKELWQTWIERNKEDLEDCRHFPSNVSMEEAIDIFRDLFFGGRLPTIKFFWMAFGLVNAQGESIRSKSVASLPERLVVIKLDPYKVQPSAESKKASLISLLLLELVHAYLEYYSCKGEEGCQHGAGCNAKNYLPHGQIGYGPAWQILAAAVEELGTEWLGLKIDLERRQMVKSFVEEFGVAPFVDETQMLELFPEQRDARFREEVVVGSWSRFGR